MDPETTQTAEEELVTTTDTQPHPVNQVKTVSKYLALVLFILLPFLGGYIGYTYAPEKVVEVEKIIEMDTVGEASIGTTELVYISYASRVMTNTLLFEDLEIEKIYGDFTLKSVTDSDFETDSATFVGETELVGRFVNAEGPKPAHFIPSIASMSKLPVVVQENLVDDFRVRLSSASDFCIFDKTPGSRNLIDTIPSNFFKNSTDYYSFFNEKDRTLSAGYAQVSDPVKVKIRNLRVLDPATSNWCYSSEFVSFELL